MNDPLKENFLEYFVPMLCDETRNNSYELAIFKAVNKFISDQGRRPIVLDVGAGTGMLSLFAAKAGAAKVVGIEANKFRAKLAEKNIEKQDFCRTVKIVNCKSTEFETKEPFDIVVSELMGTAVLDEEMNGYLADLIERKVVRKFQGYVYSVPSHVEMWIQQFKCIDKDFGVQLMRRELLKDSTGEFEQCHLLGLYPHNDAIVPVGPRISLVDQSTYTPLSNKTIDVAVEKGNYLLSEWRCRLFGDIYIENTVDAVSKLSPFQYSMRMTNWGFRAFSTLEASQVEISTTKGDLKVFSKRKRSKK